MNTILLITTENNLSTNRYDKLLAKLDYPTQRVSSSEVVPPALIDRLFLAIITDCPADLPRLLSELQLPVSLPVLLLGDSPSPPSAATEQAPGRLIDYLGGCPDTAALKAKIAFLEQVAKISSEREKCIQVHKQYLDWFSSRDGLTGLFNRHHFSRILPDLFQAATTKGSELSLLLLDIDYFSDINATCGRSFGDFVVNELSARITTTTRREDCCFRISGGEFAVLMPGTDLQTARQTAGELLVCCGDKPFVRNMVERRATVSIGLASRTPHTPASMDEFVNMAETALFKAKAEGRNRVYVYAPRETSDPSQVGNSFDTVKVTIHRLLEKTRTSTISSLQLLARDIAGPGHREHLERVSRYLELLCGRLGLTTPIVQTLQNAIILHTSIRHLIHNDLLTKQTTFSRHDYAVLRDFPYKLSEIVEIFDYFSQERQILLTRTEKFDGSGYPEGLKGDEIPLGARIISVIDAFAAMEANRPHRPRLSPEQILAELKNEAGRQFDPFLVLTLLDIIEKNGLLTINTEDLTSLRMELRLKLAHQKL